jgi:acyl-CoA thioesterase II
MRTASPSRGRRWRVGDTVDALIRLLDLEPLEVNLFRGLSTSSTSGRGVFGGQVIGQALVAAEHTVEGRAPHSIHAYFLLPGDPSASIVYQVERIRDGRSYSARRVQAVQHGRPIFSMIASFQVPETGLEHSAPMPDVPAPEALPASAELRQRWLTEAPPDQQGSVELAFRGPSGIEYRRVEAGSPLEPPSREPRSAFWFRCAERVSDDPQVHRCLLAYASDWGLIGTALRPHGKRWWYAGTFIASIDHALWFHRPARVDEWLLYVTDSPSAQMGRGFARGLVYDRGGRLVASVAQEGVIRQGPRPQGGS